MKKIIVDIYGADLGAKPVICGTLEAMENSTDFSVVFVGEEELIKNTASMYNVASDRIEILNTDKFVTDKDLPTCVFGGYDDTSMVMALEALKNDEDTIGMISAGNTGALLVGCVCRLGLVRGLKLPALSTAIPCSGKGLLCLVDCGANTDCKASDLLDYALMGDAFMKSMSGLESPRIALMSVGKEKHKGSPLSKEAYMLLEQQSFNFIGNIEGDDIVKDVADVIVCDGYSGNIILKNTEAAGKAALAVVENLASEYDREDDELILKIKEKLYNQFEFNKRGGATFLGTKKIVVKMHGCAEKETAFSCVNQVLKLYNGNFIDKIKEALKK